MPQWGQEVKYGDSDSCPYGGKWRFSAERGLFKRNCNKLCHCLITGAIIELGIFFLNDIADCKIRYIYVRK